MTIDALTNAAFAVFEATKAIKVDPPVLLPARLPLELSGEAVRTRLCIFPGAHEDLALRPDLTLAIAQIESARRTDEGGTKQAYCYNARAYRLPALAGDPHEFAQIGFEQFGSNSTPDTDVEVFSTVWAAVKTSGAPIGNIVLGDLAILPAIIDALGLPDVTSATLKRAFRQPGNLSDALEAGSFRQGQKLTRLARQFHKTSAEDGAAMVSELLALSGLKPVGVRSFEEIAERLGEKAAQTQDSGLSSDAAKILQDALSISGAPNSALTQLNTLIDQWELQGVKPLLDRLAQRLEDIRKIVGDVPCLFDVGFGRRFTYYDGFVFEIFAPGANMMQPFAAGGRYDSLLQRMSDGTVNASGIGGVVRPDRLFAARSISS